VFSHSHPHFDFLDAILDKNAILWIFCAV
jgi:hypothetical protein